MLANNLTLDDEEAVQEEFKELQALTVSLPVDRRSSVPLDTSSGSQGWTKERYPTPRRSRYRTRQY